MAPKRGGRRASAASVPIPLPTAHPGKGMAIDQWKACLDILTAVYNTKDGNRDMTDIFRQLPDRKIYADYFEAIPEPECLDNVSTRLGEGGFEHPEEFFKQLHLVFLNAKHYNEDDSVIWKDANQLEDQIKAAWKTYAAAGTFNNADPYHRQTAKKGKQAKARDGSAARVSQTPIPATGTPAAPAPVALPKSKSCSPPSAVAVPSPVSSEKIEKNDKGRHGRTDKQVIDALDARLPQWPGPQATHLPGPNLEGIKGSGWWGEGSPEYERSAGGPSAVPQRMRVVMNALSGYRDVSGKRLAESLDAVPATIKIPYLSTASPLSFASITINSNAGRYRTLRDLDMDMSRLFEKSRRYFLDGSPEYGHILVLQRLYNALTAPYPLVLPPSGIPDPSPIHFASLPAGPGNARSQHETSQEIRAGAAEHDVGHGITTFRVGTKDRKYTDEARHKGQSFKTGDFVHLINPDDAARPIIGQVFKSFVPTKGYKTHHLTVCWYFRPEQTVHTADRTFFEREVFKTSHLCDHPVEDILERVSVQFYVKWIRGRSQAPEFYPGWPVYVCHSRYNDRAWQTVRIKNWGSCIPDELRQTNFMAVTPFERQVEPEVVKSPFLLGVKGPGFFAEPRGKANDGEEEEEDARRSRPTPKRAQSPTLVPTPLQAPPRAQPLPQPVTAQLLNGGQPSRTTATQAQASTSIQLQPRNVPASSSASLTQRPPAAATPQSAPSTFRPIPYDANTYRESLAPETVKLFERDSRGQVLWFSGPPLAPGTIHIPEQPRHSLEYLDYLAKRRKGLDTTPIRLPRIEQELVVERLADEQIAESWWVKGMTSQDLEKALRATIQ